MSEAVPEKAQINVTKSGETISIEIVGKTSQGDADSWTTQAQNAISLLLEKANIKQVFYIDDIFEIIDDFSSLSGKIKGLMVGGKTASLKAAITDINFDLPPEAFDQHLKKIWDENSEKRTIYLTKAIGASGEDPDFRKDLTSKNKIEAYFPEGVVNKLSPTQWQSKKKEILEGIPKDGKALLLFDNIFKHSPPPLDKKEGLEFIIEIIKSPSADKTVCGLWTHAVKKNDELRVRREMCDQKKIPIQNFFILSKERSDKALELANGIKKALLNSSCEIIKKRTIEIIKEAQKATIDRLDSLDAYAFDHIIINSSFKEGIWEPETLFRINNFLFNDNAKELIVKDKDFRDVVNTELEHARSIGRVEIGGISYDDHLSLRNQELYESGPLINELNSPIENGDIFFVENGPHKGKYILVTQQCDLMIRSDDGARTSRFGTLLKIEEGTEKSLINEIQKYNRKDPLRQHYFSDKFKLPYFDYSSGEIKVGVVVFDEGVLIDMSVLDLSVFNKEGKCKIDYNNLPQSSPQLQSAWRKRFEQVVKQFGDYMKMLDGYSPSISKVDPEAIRKELWKKLMPNVSFIDGLVTNPAYNSKIFDFGIKRILRYRAPGSVSLLNRYTRHLSRDAEDHDFAG